LTDVMSAGARGVEVLISGKVPSSRAKTWRFYMGYLKKSGDIAVSGVDTAYTSAKLKTGVIGVQVRIMPRTTKMPDEVIFIDEAKLEDVTTGKTEALSADAAKSDDDKDKKSKKPKKSDAGKDKKPRAKKAKSESKELATEKSDDKPQEKKE